MYKNKQGMSAIITMLIIIALVLVAIGAVWYVVQNVLEQGTTETEQAVEDIFDDCVAAEGAEMVNETHVDDTTACSDTVRIIGGEYCCI